jgi:hypothetical protein
VSLLAEGGLLAKKESEQDREHEGGVRVEKRTNVKTTSLIGELEMFRVIVQLHVLVCARCRSQCPSMY